MAYIIESIKKMSIKNRKKVIKNELFNKEDKIFALIVTLSTIIIAVDYVLIVKFIKIIKNI